MAEKTSKTGTRTMNGGHGGYKGTKHVALRVIKMLFSFYPKLLPAVIICVILHAIVQSAPNIFMQNALAIVGESWESGD